MAHTGRCPEIVNAARELLRNYETIALPRSFDPFTVTGRVTIACNYLERVLILPKFVRTVRETAPGLAMAIMVSSGRGDAQLETAEASYLLGPMVPMDTGFHSQKLFDEHYVCVMDRDNPLARAPLSRRSYLACNHALITYGGSGRSGFRTELEELYLELNNVLVQNHLTSQTRYIQRYWAPSFPSCLHYFTTTYTNTKPPISPVGHVHYCQTIESTAAFLEFLV